MRRRILRWKQISPVDCNIAVNFPYALNTGVFGFSDDSKFMKDWYGLANLGRDQYIPDEVSCQIFIYKYPHLILSRDYNTSCKYDPICDATKIVHYHGRKNCRWKNGDFEFNGGLWVNEFKEIKDKPFMKEAIASDPRLKGNLKIIDSYKGKL